MVSVASLGDVVKQSGEIKHFRSFETGDELGAKRIFVTKFRCHETAKIPYNHQNMLIHRVDMEQIMLHLSHNASKRWQVASKDAEAIHKSQFMGQPPRLPQNFHEH